MKLTGKNFVGNSSSGEGAATFHAVNPLLQAQLLPEFFEATHREVDAAVSKAREGFARYSRRSGKERASFLTAIAENINALGDELLSRCSEETGLPEERLIGERTRTVNQLRLFAGLLSEGSWVDARIDTALPQRTPVPRPDIRSAYRPLGPVGIFGASNFPLAFSVAGGDTASALAAGCSVIFKAHPAHPGTCEMIGTAILHAVSSTGMPDGTFSMVQGKSTDVGMGLVRNPEITAIAFTGSFRGGKALFDAGVRRQNPIPVYAEMGSSNPVFILPGALKSNAEGIAKGLTGSVTLGVGQFCTNPGLVFLIDEGTEFQSAAARHFREVMTSPMLTEGIHQAFLGGIERLERNNVEVLARGRDGGPAATLLSISIDRFLKDKQFEEEVFGPSTLLVIARAKEELLSAAHSLGGHLTATIWGMESDFKEFADLVAVLERKAGRLIVNGFPTGVEVCQSMVHGGPFPATTDSRTTSVGTRAITRFARPVCYQGFSDDLLPDELKNGNPLGIWRIVDGERTRSAIP
jgi:alpha-ketoglutaric semialdehyde dehydrogenase